MRTRLATRVFRRVKGWVETTVAVTAWLTLMQQGEAADKLLRKKEKPCAADAGETMKTHRDGGEEPAENDFNQQIN